MQPSFAPRLAVWIGAAVLVCSVASRVEAQSTDACLDWRWIALASGPDADCSVPTASGWSGAALFSAASIARSRDLGRYCVFESVSQSADPGQLRAYTAGRFARIDRDCAAAGSHAGERGSRQRWTALASELRSQSGANAVPPELLSGPHRVRLAVIDSNPTNAVDPARDLGRSPHGNALLTIAEQLACPQGDPCPIAVTSRLGLSFVAVDTTQRRATDRDRAGGGMLGSIADVAAAIDAELVDWRGTTPDHRLVVNLSLGWAPSFGGIQARVADMPVPVQAAHAILQDASCQGVLVFAAAGNREAGLGEESGPLYPAAWETRPAPDAATCARLQRGGSSVMPEVFGGAYRPLVHAVAGIEADGTPLDNARVRGAPRLAAYGDHAVAESIALAAAPSGQPTATLTGSSVATLLASVNAAVAWSWQASRSPHDIAALLHGAARGTTSVLGRTADFCLRPAGGGCADSIHRIDLCLTRKAADPGTAAGLRCDWQPSDPALQADRSAFDADAIEIDLSHFVQSGAVAACGAATIHVDASMPTPRNPCPHLALLGVGTRPWVMPQPGSDACPHCEDTDETTLQKAAGISVAPARMIRIEIAPALSRPIDEMVLVVGSRLFVLTPGHAITGGMRFVVRGLADQGLDKDSLEHALLAFSIDRRYAAVSPLLHER